MKFWRYFWINFLATVPKSLVLVAIGYTFGGAGTDFEVDLRGVIAAGGISSGSCLWLVLVSPVACCMSGATFTCLIPAFNEADRIADVLAAVRLHPLVEKTIVIDDGSTDQTAQVARSTGVEVLQTSGNIGKTAALALGLRNLTTSHVLLLDADLIGLTSEDVTELINPVLQCSAIASLSLRGNAPRLWRLIGLDYISGERVVPYALLASHLEAMEALPRFGFEVFLNRLLIASHQPIAVVPLPHVASPSKANKRGAWAGIKADASMMQDIFKTVSGAEILHQIFLLKRRQLAARN